MSMLSTSRTAALFLKAAMLIVTITLITVGDTVRAVRANPVNALKE